MSTSKTNGKPDTFLAPEVPQLIGAISTAMDLLEAAGGLMYENATRDLAKFLVLARVSTAEALTLVEEEQ